MDVLSRKRQKEIKNSIKDPEGSLIFLEGTKLLDSIKDPSRVRYAVISRDIADNQEKYSLIAPLLKNCEIFVCSQEQFSFMSGLKSPEGVMLAVEKPFFSPEVFFSGPCSRGILLDNIQDPGNLGTIIRSCHAFGISAVFLYGSHCSPYNPKCLRASMGTILSMPVFSSKRYLLRDFINNRISLYRAIRSRNSTRITEISFRDRSIIAFGNEGHGFSEEIMNMQGDDFYIPMENGLDSVNLASCTAITLFYAGLISGRDR